MRYTRENSGLPPELYAGGWSGEERCVSNSDFLGVYVMKSDARRDLLPVSHPNGLWQVWQTPEGNVIIQALDENRAPWGMLFLMEQQEFAANFLRHEGAEAPARTVRADATDLFSIWYESAKDDPYHQKSDADAAATPVPAPASPAKPGGTLDSPWLDAFFNEEEPPSGTEEPAAVVEEDIDALAQKQEVSMRAAFASLALRLQEGDTAAPPELDRLIERQGSFTWKQKYMFTEFGLTLRKLHCPAQALACHLRALALSPNDEHVLFNVARSEYETGNISAAKAHLHESLAAAPDFEAARNFLEFLNSGGA